LEQNKRMNSLVDEANCWRISKVRRAEDFFRAIERLVPEATHMYVEGSPGPDVIAALQPHVEPKKYVAPAGTVWSWPRRNQRLTLRVSPALFDLLADLASHHAEPEICSHLHLYRDDEALLHWFDAFDDPIVVSKTVPRDRVERFCTDAHAVLLNSAL
jgi:hypothetical protein